MRSRPLVTGWLRITGPCRCFRTMRLTNKHPALILYNPNSIKYASALVALCITQNWPIAMFLHTVYGVLCFSAPPPSLKIKTNIKIDLIKGLSDSRAACVLLILHNKYVMQVYFLLLPVCMREQAVTGYLAPPPPFDIFNPRVQHISDGLSCPRDLAPPRKKYWDDMDTRCASLFLSFVSPWKWACLQFKQVIILPRNQGSGETWNVLLLPCTWHAVNWNF